MLWFTAFVALLLHSAASENASDPNLDRFNYDETNGLDFGPPDWINVRCTDLSTCQGWPDAWEMALDWALEENSCRWCPKDNDGLCGNHHQSPIDLERNRAIEGHEYANECIDVHWMAYFDSTCSFDMLQEHNAFSIERHALKIAQPLEEFEPNRFRLACENAAGQRQWGRIDFSKGFSDWWHLSHTDIHVPSEHTQEGKRYSGELQMYHWYSVNATVAGINNEMAAVTVFLEAYEDAVDYDFLNKLICQWRKVEDRVRDQCNLPSVSAEYPGCFFYRRGQHTINSTIPESGRKNLRRHTEKSSTTFKSRPTTAHDIVVRNSLGGVARAIVLDENDISEGDDFDWDAFVASQYRDDGHHRHLIDFDHVGPWTNYFPMLGVRTEYYYRYSGSQTVPPCYGKWFSGNRRRQTNHWRVMKDPIRVSSRQILELHRLLRERVAAPEDPLVPCQVDTGAKIEMVDPTRVSVARPLQSTRPVHFKVFCECDDWPSKWIEDQEWCRKEKLVRLYQHPYNYETSGF